MTINWQLWWNGVGYTAGACVVLITLGLTVYKVACYATFSDATSKVISSVAVVLGVLVAIGVAAGTFVR